MQTCCSQSSATKRSRLDGIPISAEGGSPVKRNLMIDLVDNDDINEGMTALSTPSHQKSVNKVHKERCLKMNQARLLRRTNGGCGNTTMKDAEVTGVWNGLLLFLEKTRSKGQSILEEESRMALTLISSVYKLFTESVYPLLDAIPNGQQVKDRLPWLERGLEIAQYFTGIEESTIRQTVWPEFEAKNTFYKTDNSKRGTASPDHPQFKLYADLRHLLVDYVVSEAGCAIEHGRRVTLRKLTISTNLYLKAQTVNPSLATMKVGRRFVRTILRENGFEYGCIYRDVQKLMESPERQQSMNRWALLYDHALKEQKEGKAIIIATDESYIHTNHHKQCGWRSSSRPVGKIPTSKGSRLIILHALCEDGLCTKVSAEGEMPAYNPNIYDALESTEVIFKGVCMEPNIMNGNIVEKKDKRANYHDTISSPLYMSWVNSRLITWIKAYVPPEKKVYLLLDNASYHHAKDKDSFNPLAPSLTKKELIKRMIVLLDGQQLRLPSTGQMINIGLELNNSSRSATLKELKRASYLWIRENKPEVLLTALDKVLKEHNICPIFTPPYCTRAQPIEHVWSVGKGYAADNYDPNEKSESQIAHKLREGWYVGVSNKSLKYEPGSKCAAGYFSHSVKESNKEYLQYVKMSNTNEGLGTFILSDTEQNELNRILQDPYGTRIELIEVEESLEGPVLSKETDEQDAEEAVNDFINGHETRSVPDISIASYDSKSGLTKTKTESGSECIVKINENDVFEIIDPSPFKNRNPFTFYS